MQNWNWPKGHTVAGHAGAECKPGVVRDRKSGALGSGAHGHSEVTRDRDREPFDEVDVIHAASVRAMGAAVDYAKSAKLARFTQAAAGPHRSTSGRYASFQYRIGLPRAGP
jgi:hypothetical protein